MVFKKQESDIIHHIPFNSYIRKEIFVFKHPSDQEKVLIMVKGAPEFIMLDCT